MTFITSYPSIEKHRTTRTAELWEENTNKAQCEIKTVRTPEEFYKEGQATAYFCVSDTEGVVKWRIVVANKTSSDKFKEKHISSIFQQLH